MAKFLRAAIRAGRRLTDLFERDGRADAEALARTAIVRALADTYFGVDLLESAGIPNIEESSLVDTSGPELRVTFNVAVRAHQREHVDLSALSAAATMLAAVHERLASPTGIGVHYTPTAIAKWMADSAVVLFLENCVGLNSMDAESVVAGHCNHRVDARLARLATGAIDQASVIDPACGTGNLLIALLDSLQRTRNTLRASSSDSDCDEILDRNFQIGTVSGFDIDPQAVAIARLRIATRLTTVPTAEDVRRIARDIRVGNALEVEASKSAETADIVILNPPYVSTYSRRSQSDLREPLRAFCERRGVNGRLNLFGCFILRAMELASDRGVVSMIVPDTFANASSYESLRAACRQRFPTQQWLQIEDRAFRAHVGSVILTCGRGAERLSAKTVRHDASSTRPAVAVRGDDERILMFASSVERDIWERVRACPNRIERFVTINDGVNTGPRRVRDILLDESTPSLMRRPLIEGGDIDRRGQLLGSPRRTIRYDARLIDDAGRRAGASLRDSAIFESPKVVTRQTADTLIAAVEPSGGVVALNSVHCWRVPGNDDWRLWGLAGFLNSSLVRLFYALDGGEQRSILPQVRIAWLRQMPVPDSFDALLPELSKPAGEVANAYHRGVPAAEPLKTIDAAVCGAFGFNENHSRLILAAYHRLFSRFADDGSPNETSTAIRVA